MSRGISIIVTIFRLFARRLATTQFQLSSNDLSIDLRDLQVSSWKASCRQTDIILLRRTATTSSVLDDWKTCKFLSFHNPPLAISAIYLSRWTVKWTENILFKQSRKPRKIKDFSMVDNVLSRLGFQSEWIEIFYNEWKIEAMTKSKYEHKNLGI